ncbi:XrtA/PEP-CTERM system histidine kinase PrsK [Aestuariispira insulae]|uniref:histidine kinase n=1 Tax=Aestuariispira insulae TaxID=1461337 RepID=A0A3D9HKE1_9PROT|nr:XrtA/PEP-CTERM system histidine kinase PrsK [Aestuariispira insulae]RED49885.1 putative PEP-CTERM system histidine kinase [Aestuariispira insulae]
MVWLIESVGYALTTATFGVLWILLITRPLQERRRRLLRLAPLLTVIWGSVSLLSSLLNLPPAYGNILQVLHSAGWLFVIHQLVNRTPGTKMRERTTLGIITAIALLTGIWSLVENAPTNLVVTFYAGSMCLMQVAGLLILENVVRHSDSERRWALKHLLLGCAAMQVFDLMLFAEMLLFGSMDPTYEVAQGYVAAIAAPLIAVSVMRYRSWKIDLHVSRDVVYHSTVLVLSGIYLLSVAAAGYYLKQFGGDWGTISSIVVAFAAVITLVLAASSASIRARIRIWIGTHFFSNKYDYRKEWLRFTEAMSDNRGGEDFHARLLRSIGDVVDSTGGAIWLHSPDDQAFALETHVNIGDELRALPADHPMLVHLHDTGHLIDFIHDDLPEELRTRLQIPTWLAENKRAWLVLPLIRMERLIGIVALARPRVSRKLDEEDADLLRVICQQVASYAAEERSQRNLEDAKQLEKFNKRFAFVVHDLKNAISQLSMMLKNAEKHAANPEFQKDMLQTVENTVERMKNMMERLKSDQDAKDNPADPPRNIKDLMAEHFAAWQKKTDAISLTMDEEPIDLAVSGEKIRSILDHLITNASEAAGENGHIELGLNRLSDRISITITDDGPGMDADFIKNKLFRPLNTSKKGGFGIGAYQVQHLAREIGGYLQVSSEPGKGTRITIDFMKKTAESPEDISVRPTVAP